MGKSSQELVAGYVVTAKDAARVERAVQEAPGQQQEETLEEATGKDQGLAVERLSIRDGDDHIVEETFEYAGPASTEKDVELQSEGNLPAEDEETVAAQSEKEEDVDEIETPKAEVESTEDECTEDELKGVPHQPQCLENEPGGKDQIELPENKNRKFKRRRLWLSIATLSVILLGAILGASKRDESTAQLTGSSGPDESACPENSSKFQVLSNSKAGGDPNRGGASWILRDACTGEPIVMCPPCRSSTSRTIGGSDENVRYLQPDDNNMCLQDILEYVFEVVEAVRVDRECCDFDPDSFALLYGEEVVVQRNVDNSPSVLLALNQTSTPSSQPSSQPSSMPSNLRWNGEEIDDGGLASWLASSYSTYVDVDNCGARGPNAQADTSSCRNGPMSIYRHAGELVEVDGCSYSFIEVFQCMPDSATTLTSFQIVFEVVDVAIPVNASEAEVRLIVEEWVRGKIEPRLGSNQVLKDVRVTYVGDLYRKRHNLAHDVRRTSLSSTRAGATITVTTETTCAESCVGYDFGKIETDSTLLILDALSNDEYEGDAAVEEVVSTFEPSLSPTSLSKMYFGRRSQPCPSKVPTSSPSVAPSLSPNKRPSPSPTNMPTVAEKTDVTGADKVIDEKASLPAEPTLSPETIELSGIPSKSPITKYPSKSPFMEPITTRSSPSRNPTEPPFCNTNTKEDFALCIALDMSGSVCNDNTGSLCLNCEPAVLCRQDEADVSFGLCCRNFKQVIEFAQEFVASMSSTIASNQQYSLVGFSNTASWYTDLVTPFEMLDVLDNVIYTGGQTNHEDAIESCHFSLDGSRNTKRMILLITGELMR